MSEDASLINRMMERWWVRLLFVLTFPITLVILIFIVAPLCGLGGLLWFIVKGDE